jgi:hypothetical protein
MPCDSIVYLFATLQISVAVLYYAPAQVGVRLLESHTCLTAVNFHRVVHLGCGNLEFEPTFPESLGMGQNGMYHLLYLAEKMSLFRQHSQHSRMSLMWVR